MKLIVDRYIDRILLYANRPAIESEPLRRELKDHLLQKTEDLIASGVPREEATLEALRQHGSPKTIGYRLRGPFPWIDIRTCGTARGVIAIGPRAVGIFAFGGVAVGVVALGGISAGVISAGGIALGLLFAWAGFGFGAIVSGGFAVGLVASGGFAFGLLAEGGSAAGLWVPLAGQATSYYHAANVPAWIKSLQWLFDAPRFLERNVLFIMPGYLLAILGLLGLQFREIKRVASDEDWIVED